MDIENIDKVKFELDMSDCIESMAEDCASLCKQRAPKRTGDYASGFVTKKVTNSKNEVVCIVGNENYRLVHLLENGHIVKNQFGNGKGKRRVAPRPHMRPAYEEVLRNIDSYVDKTKLKIKE